MSFKETVIGTIPSEWEIFSVNEISKVIDSLHQTPTYSNSGIPMVRVTDIKQDGLDLVNCLRVSDEIYELFSRNHKPGLGDIVISRVGTYGVFNLVKTSEKFCLGQNTAIISPEINSRYLFYNFINKRTSQQIDNIAVGSTQKTISLKNIKSLKIPVCSEEEQKAIADTLACLDDKIEINNLINKTLEEMAQAIFKSWFVDFEPYQDGEFEDSEVGRIPKGWSVGCADDILKQITNVCRRADISHESLYVGLEHIPRKQLVINDFGSIEDVKSDKLRFEKMHILFGKIRPYFHKVSIAPWGGYCSTDAIVLAPKTDSIFSYAVLTVFSDSFVQYAVQISQGTKMPRSEWKILKRFKVVLPPNKIMESFNLILIPFIEQIMSNYEESHRLSKIRNSLLPKLMSGEIRVPLEEVN